MTTFTVEADKLRGNATLVLAGELDHAGVSELRSTFRRLAAHYAAVMVNVCALEFCDSAGWHALEHCRDEGATLVGSPPCLRRLFFLIRHAHKLPPELHELRGLQPDAARRLAA
jgi:ABC-type transporter Mla MlaB component